MESSVKMSKWISCWIAAGLIGLGVAACSTSGTPSQNSTAASEAVPSDDQIVSAWNYLYGRYLVLQQENYDINVEKVGYNKIKYNPLGSAQFVNPNLDVAYLEAWLVADKDHAVILNVPRVKGRYYTAELLDGWGQVITNINERTYPDHPYGKFALVIKGTNPPVPSDAVKIELPSAKAKMLARVELKGSRKPQCGCNTSSRCKLLLTSRSIHPWPYRPLHRRRQFVLRFSIT
jgi:Uncharacterized conserved protein